MNNRLVNEFQNQTLMVSINAAYLVVKALSHNITAKVTVGMFDMDNEGKSLAMRLLDSIEEIESKSVTELALEVRLHYITDIDNYISARTRIELEFDDATAARILTAIWKTDIPVS